MDVVCVVGAKLGVLLVRVRWARQVCEEMASPICVMSALAESPCPALRVHLLATWCRSCCSGAPISCLGFHLATVSTLIIRQGMVRVSLDVLVGFCGEPLHLLVVSLFRYVEFLAHASVQCLWVLWGSGVQ